MFEKALTKAGLTKGTAHFMLVGEKRSVYRNSQLGEN